MKLKKIKLPIISFVFLVVIVMPLPNVAQAAWFGNNFLASIFSSVSDFFEQISTKISAVESDINAESNKKNVLRKKTYIYSNLILTSLHSSS